MNADSPSTLPTNAQETTDPILATPAQQLKLQIRLKNEDGVVKLILPTEAETPAAEEKSQISEPNQTMAAPAAIKTEAITDKIRRAASNDIIPSDSAMASSYKQAKTHTPKKEDTDANSKEMAVEDSPELWLKNIGDLRQKGELDAAHKSLDTFKLRYPDYKLPKDLMEFEK